MSTIALAGLVALLALSFWRPLRSVRRALGFSHLIASGYAFVGVGLVAGYALGSSRHHTLVDDLGPIVAFAAGWVGFTVGSRFESRVLRTVPPRAFARALAPAFAAAASVGAAGAVTFIAVGATPTEIIAASLCLAAAAASAGPTLAAVVRTKRVRRSRDAVAMLRMAEFAAGVADALVLALAMVSFAVFQSATAQTGSLVILAAAIGGSAVLGFALWLFLGGRADDDERLLLGLGLLAMTAGFAVWLQMPPAALAALAGAVVANMPHERAAPFLGAVRRVERPVVVILMAASGLYIAQPMSWLVAPLLAAMVVLRLVAKTLAAGSPVRALASAPSLGAPRGWTLALAPQGILGLVVALSFLHVWNDAVGRGVLAAVALGGLLNEGLAPWLLLRAVRRASAPEGP